MNVWPATLPQRAQVQGYSRALGDARLRTPMDAGTPKMRRRLSFIPQPIKAAIVMSTEQRGIFERFADKVLAGGTLPFIFPAVDQDGTWIVQLGETMPNWTQRSPGFWLVVLDLVKLGRGQFAIGDDAIPDARQGEVYANWKPRILNGDPPYSIAISAGSLPDGMTFDVATGAIGGKPVRNGASTFTILVTDAAGRTVSLGRTLIVRPPAFIYANGAILEPSVQRASRASYFDASGVMRTAEPGELRLDHNPATKVSLGMLVEEARPNFVTFSDEADNAIYVKLGSLIQANIAPSPNGLISADRLIDNSSAAAAQRLIQRRSISVESGSVFTVSRFVKYDGNKRSFGLYPYVTAAIGVLAHFDLVAETHRVQNFGTAIGVSGMQKLADGWLKLFVTMTLAEPTTLLQYSDFTSNVANSNASSVGDGTGPYISELMIEPGAFPTSLIHTDSAVVTRAADRVSFTLPSGAHSLNYTFDDNSTLLVPGVTGDYTIPTNLPRRHIRSIVATKVAA